MIDLDSDDFSPNQDRVDWLKDIKRANIKTDCKDYRQYRLFGKAFRIGNHRIEWYSAKKKKDVVFNHLCPKLNPETCNFDRKYPEDHPTKAGKLVGCPYCDDMSKKPSEKYMIHAIDRVLEKQGVDPVVVLSLPQGVMITLWNKRQLNKVNGKPMAISHDDYGYDIYLKFDPDASGKDMYSIETPPNSMHTPLTPAQKAYTTYDIQGAYRSMGVQQADEGEFRTFLSRIGMLKDPNAAATGTQMGSGPVMGSGGFGGIEDSLPESYNTVPNTGFTPPVTTQIPSGFTPPTITAEPSARFSGAAVPTPATDTLAVAIAGSAATPGMPSCFKDENKMGVIADCVKCPVRKACFS